MKTDLLANLKYSIGKTLNQNSTARLAGAIMALAEFQSLLESLRIRTVDDVLEILTRAREEADKEWAELVKEFAKHPTWWQLLHEKENPRLYVIRSPGYRPF